MNAMIDNVVKHVHCLIHFRLYKPSRVVGAVSEFGFNAVMLGGSSSLAPLYRIIILFSL